LPRPEALPIGLACAARGASRGLHLGAMDILFITATRIGDAVLSTGLLAHLAEHYRDARFTIAAGPVAAPLFEAFPALRRLIVVEKRRYALHWLPLYAATIGTRWDLVLDLRSSALPWLLRARERRIGAKPDPGEHRVQQLARTFDLDPPPAPRIWLDASHEQAAASLAPPGGPILAIGPAANWRGKQWRGERFAELALRLTAPGGILPGARVAILAAAHERTQAASLLAAVPEERRIDLVGKVDLLTAAAVLRRCALFIGNDTGLMHIAAAAGAPTIGLFGPTQAAQYAPWGERNAVAHTTTPPDRLYGADFDHRTTGSMMDSLSVDAAEAVARQLWRSIGGEAA
jgi:heptosyltransferase III